MGLDFQIKGSKKRSLEAFVKCHPKGVADELTICEFLTIMKKMSISRNCLKNIFEIGSLKN